MVAPTQVQFLVEEDLWVSFKKIPLAGVAGVQGFF